MSAGLCIYGSGVKKDLGYSFGCAVISAALAGLSVIFGICHYMEG